MNTFQSHATKDLVSYYNEGAEELGRPTINKFSDRTTAERRCEEMRQALREQRAAVITSEKPKPNPHAATFKKTPAAKPKPTKEPKQLTNASSTTDWNFATVREGSKRAQLLDLLVAHRNQFVTVDAMSQAVYGTAETKGAVLMVLKGIKADIEKNSVPAKLEQQKADKVISYGLFDA